MLAALAATIAWVYLSFSKFWFTLEPNSGANLFPRIIPRNMKTSKKQVCRKEFGSCEMVYVNFQANTYIHFCHIAKNAIFLNRSQEIMVSIGVMGAKFWCKLISSNSSQKHEDIQKTSMQVRRW